MILTPNLKKVSKVYENFKFKTWWSDKFFRELANLEMLQNINRICRRIFDFVYLQKPKNSFFTNSSNFL